MSQRQPSQTKQPDLKNEPPTSTEPESPVQSPVPDGTCKTQESANTATRQRNTHSTGDSQAFRPFKPTLHPSVAAKTSIKVEKPLWVPSAGCQGYWSKTNAALAAVIEQTCPGLSSKPPHLALQSLTKFVHSFFAEEETSSSPPEMKKRTRNRGSPTPTSKRNLRKKLRELRREWRQRCNEPSEDTAELRHEFHQTHKRIKRLASQQKSSEKNERLMKEAFKFRSNPYKYGRKVFNQKVPKIHLFQQRKQRHSFQNVLLTPTVAIATALSVNCPHLLRQSLTSLRLRLRLMTSKRCSSRDETLQPLVQTASPTLCGNVASASIGRYTLSSAEFELS